MKSILISTILTISAAHCFALSNTQCWKGYSQADQNNNAALCQTQRQPGQKCETNAWNTGEGVYDVCLQGATHTLKVVSCLKGYGDADQQKNLSQCQKQIGEDQVCETNAWTTGQGVYDVCIMQ